jgi:diguanylate cyclase (GGDEF)-like protein
MSRALKERTQALTRRLSLAGRFTLFVCTLLVCFAWALTFVSSGALRRAVEQRIANMTTDITVMAAPDVRAGLDADDQETFDQVARRIARLQHVESVELMDHEGDRLAISGMTPAIAPRTAVMEAISRGEVRRVQNDLLIEVIAPLRSGEQSLGAVRFSLSRATLGQNYAAEWLTYILMAAALLIVAIPLTMMFTRMAMRPLTQLTTFAQNLSDQTLTDRLELKTADEFQTLAEAFNRMLARLDASMRRARKLAFIDPITELPNAEYFNRVTQERITHLKQEGGDALGAIIVIGFDRLDRVVESLGQGSSQEVLTLLAQRLSSGLRVADRAVRLTASVDSPSVAARISGQEFAVFAPSLASKADAARLAQLVVAALSQPLQWRDHKLLLGVSAGVALAPTEAATPEAAIRQARLAGAAARSEQKAVRVFTKSLDRAAVARLQFEREMRDALEAGQFRAFFQPKVGLLTGKIEGCEALARWILPDRSYVSPAKFIPVAEENGMIGALSNAIFTDACKQAAAWAGEGFRVSVAVNVSPMQFADDRFAEIVLRMVEEAGLAPELLQLEITESVAVTNFERVQHMIEPLRSRGLQFALDDFGTGHSSLAALTRLPFDVLKIDQSFVRGLTKDRHAPAIVETILAMAASLNFETVAEGVEAEEEANFLRLRGCSSAQGYLYGPALPAAEFMALLRAQAGRAEVGLRGFAA